jgi:hypothetical protein
MCLVPWKGITTPWKKQIVSSFAIFLVDANPIPMDRSYNPVVGLLARLYRERV